MKKKKILIMGGIAQQADIITNAMLAGYHVIVIDNIRNSPGKVIADEAYNISITDVDSIVRLCREKSIDGVMNYCIDPGQKPYQEVCERLKLPCYGTKEQFNVLTNKELFKNICEKNGVDIIPSYAIDDSNIDFPIVVKPIDGRASKGMKVCYNYNEFEEGIKLALMHSFSKKIIVEKHLDCPEFCAKYFVIDNEIHLTLLSDTYTTYYKGERVYLSGKVYPSRFVGEFKEKVDRNLRRLIKSLGVSNGPISFTGFYDKGRFRFFDPSFRFGGGQEWATIEKVSGFDLSGMMTNYAVNGKMSNSKNSINLDYMFLNTNCLTLQILCHPGTISSIDGVKSLDDISSVYNYHLCKDVGDTIKNFGNTDCVFMRVMLENKLKDALIEDAKKVFTELKVINTDNRNMLIPFSFDRIKFNQD